jgi:hypothetical protein
LALITVSFCSLETRTWENFQSGLSGEILAMGEMNWVEHAVRIIDVRTKNEAREKFMGKPFTKNK